ncbi:Oligogalacturonate-specific porin [Enterobacter cloacae]|uniref:Oligogalacturonate-specific porin n=1 Tax=Enterobacter cloacae TaxID=550 RepID=A0A377LT13_ENTCL|nr:Oligogalacturonate-specific porin [Enterobacter cloacae]
MTKLNRGDAWVGWVMGDWRTELNYVYAKSTEGMVRNNNKDYSTEYNAKLAYKWDKNWAPYVEVGNVGVKESDERQNPLPFRRGVFLLIFPSRPGERSVTGQNVQSKKSPP